MSLFSLSFFFSLVICCKFMISPLSLFFFFVVVVVVVVVVVIVFVFCLLGF